MKKMNFVLAAIIAIVTSGLTFVAAQDKPSIPALQQKTVRKTVSLYEPMVKEGEGKVLWQKLFPDGSQFTFSFLRVKTVPLLRVKNEFGGYAEPVQPEATLVFSLIQHKKNQSPLVLWKQQLPFYSGFHYNLMDASIDKGNLTMVFKSEGFVSQAYVFSEPLKGLPLNLKDDSQLKRLYVPTNSKRPVQLRKTTGNIRLKDAEIVDSSPNKRQKILLTWSDSGTTEWELRQKEWKQIRPYTPPRPLTPSEIATQKKVKERQSWMPAYRRRREVFGQTKEQARANVRFQSRIKDWQPLKEAWDTPDLKPKMYWLTPTPPPTTPPAITPTPTVSKEATPNEN